MNACGGVYVCMAYWFGACLCLPAVGRRDVEMHSQYYIYII